MCSLDVRLTFSCVFNVMSFPQWSSVENSKNTSKTHATVKRTYKLTIQNASVIEPLVLEWVTAGCCWQHLFYFTVSLSLSLSLSLMPFDK
jgi:hypothetical protein